MKTIRERYEHSQGYYGIETYFVSNTPKPYFLQIHNGILISVFRIKFFK